jgi:hypothetical protein
MLAFIICLTLVILIRQLTAGRFAVHQLDFYDNGADWRDFHLTNIYTNKDSSRMIIAGDDASLISPVCKTKFPFNEIIMCWNCFAGDSSGLAISIAASPDNVNWWNFAYQNWRVESDFGAIDEDSLPRKKISGAGFVDIDIIKLEKPAIYYKFKIVFSHKDSLPFYLDRISICYSNTHADIRQQGIWGNQLLADLPKVALAVPFLSQKALPDSISDRTCSPTSLAMVLNYHNHQCFPLEVSAAVYDPFAEIYGNWPYNIQAAYLMGLQKTWIGRHNSFFEIASEINSGKPVIISIDVPPAKLANAPYPTTGGAGHLIVVRGFDGEGNVLVNDPAGENPHEGMVAYDLKALTEIWVERGGVAYHLWPEP